MGNAQQGDALPGAVGIFQPIAGLGAEKPGFRVPAPAAVGGMENTVVRNEVGQLLLAEHRKVEAVAPWQIPRGVFRYKGNAPLGEHPGDFLVAAGGGAAAAPGSACHQGVLADQFLLTALTAAPPENATPCPPLPTVLQHGAFSKPLALQVPYPILMGMHLHHLAAVALTVPKGARPRLGPAPQGEHHQLPKPLPGEVLPPHAAAADGAPLAQVARRDLALRPTVALTLPDCTSIGPPRLRQRQDGQAAKSLAGKVIRHAGGQTAAAFYPAGAQPPCGGLVLPAAVAPAQPHPLPTLPLGQHPLHHQAVEALPGEVVALGCLGLVPGLGHLPAKAAAALGDPPAQAGAPGGDPSPALAGAAVPGFPARHAGRRRHLFHHRQPAKSLSHHGNSGPGHSVPPLFYGQAPVPVRQTQGPAYATKNPGISWDTRDSRIFNMVTRRGFEPRTPCLKGRCSAD